jgi:cellulose synthase/poly-beta-1,6-N-acetylglucosamine synthase-like glycosyltransferase
VTTFLSVLFWLSVSLAAAPLVIYPASMALLTIGRREPGYPDDELPTVSLVISAFNEAGVIDEKLRNSLALDYPQERLEIVLISDCSDDGTDEIAAHYAEHGVVICRQAERRGKSQGLTDHVPNTRGSILVFSDANSMYDPQALRYLVRPFSQSNIGYVVGHQRFYGDEESAAAESEGTYWDFEVRLKMMESLLSSVVGGDGAIFAMRRELFEPLEEHDINDFLIPLKIVLKGLRGVFERRAFCYEHAAPDFEGEFRRKARIVTRSLQAMGKTRATLNPFRTGWFSYQLLLHKVLRWFLPFSLLVALSTAVLLAFLGAGIVYGLTAAAGAVLLLLASLMIWPRARRWPLAYLPYFFVVSNVAAATGSIKALTGVRVSTWKPERG